MESRTREALGELEVALGLTPDHPELLAARGHLLCELEQYEEAVKTYSRLLEVASGHTASVYNLAVCLEKLGRWEQAAERFSEAQALDPDRIEAKLGLGICQLHLEKPEPA
ncbi:MAG: hypothetical protein B7X34_01965, partial [Acidobacteriia bacterium 12-62-4]